jgi:hypothetical protein
VAFVPKGFARGGPLHAGDILVSNFNSASGGQGTGSTIVQITQPLSLVNGKPKPGAQPDDHLTTHRIEPFRHYP